MVSRTADLALFETGFDLLVPGGRTVLTRQVPGYTTKATLSMFQSLVPEYSADSNVDTMSASQFDWALHAGGESIIQGVKRAMNLAHDQLRATQEVYRSRGNSSSPTVLIVLDKLRNMGHGRDRVVAASFGPGITIEMAFLRRCREREGNRQNGESMSLASDT
jgi:type III polyketide synthase